MSTPQPPTYSSPPQQGAWPPPQQGQYSYPPPGEQQQWFQAPPPGNQQPQGSPYPPQGYHSGPPPSQGYYQPPQGYPQYIQQEVAPSSLYPPQQQQQPLARPVFRWSSPNPLESTVSDQKGQIVYKITSQKKKQTRIENAAGRTVAEIEWASNATLKLHGGKEMKFKDWLPYNKQVEGREFRHNGDLYASTQRGESLVFLKNGVQQDVVVLSSPNDIAELEISHELLPILDEFIVIAVALSSPYDLEKKGSWFNPQYAVYGAVAGYTAS